MDLRQNDERHGDGCMASRSSGKSKQHAWLIQTGMPPTGQRLNSHFITQDLLRHPQNGHPAVGYRWLSHQYMISCTEFSECQCRLNAVQTTENVYQVLKSTHLGKAIFFPGNKLKCCNWPQNQLHGQFATTYNCLSHLVTRQYTRHAISNTFLIYDTQAMIKCMPTRSW